MAKVNKRNDKKSYRYQIICKGLLQYLKVVAFCLTKRKKNAAIVTCLCDFYVAENEVRAEKKTKKKKRNGLRLMVYFYSYHFSPLLLIIY